MSLLATARSGRRDLVSGGSAALMRTSALSAPARRAAPAEPVAPDGPHTGALAGNRPADGQARPPLRFDKKPGRGAVRRQITYRLIRLSEGQDELRSREIMRLDRGDEVEIVDQQGRFMQVRTPTGAIGWIPTDSTS